MCLDNYRVFQFYKNNPYINFEDVNIFFVECFEKIIHNAQTDNNNDYVIKTIQNLYKNNQQDFIQTIQNDKKNYIEEIKTFINIHTNDKITNVINQANQVTQDKINIIINDKIKYIENKMNDINEISIKNYQNQNQIYENVNTIVKKMENSSLKGAISENLLYNVIENIFSNAEIILTNKEAHHGDIIIKRFNKQDILLENKDYNYNVPKKEIEKFIDDINNNNSCGIMISQKSGIALKDNFQIEIYNKNIVIYLHNVQYSRDIIKTAIHIIDHLYQQINIEKDENIKIDKNTIEDINIEYKNYAVLRIEHIEYIKEMANNLIKQTEEMKHPSIEGLLNRYCNTSINKEFSCACGKIWASKRSLASHQKTCKKFKNK
jgi:hypothetical protein